MAYQDDGKSLCQTQNYTLVCKKRLRLICFVHEFLIILTRHIDEIFAHFWSGAGEEAIPMLHFNGDSVDSIGMRDPSRSGTHIHFYGQQFLSKPQRAMVEKWYT